MKPARVLEAEGRPDLALIARGMEEREAVLAAVRLVVPHQDHEHRFSFGADGPAPPEVKLRCGVCRRAMRELTLDHSAGICVLGGLFAEGRPGELGANSARVSSTERRRAADCFDAGPGGWSAAAGRTPTHYRLVCRHHGEDPRPPLSRKILAATLLTRYLDAVCAGKSSIVLD